MTNMIYTFHLIGIFFSQTIYQRTNTKSTLHAICPQDKISNFCPLKFAQLLLAPSSAKRRVVQ